MGKQYLLPFKSRMLVRRSSGERGLTKMAKKIKFPNGSGEEYQVVGNLIHPCKYMIKPQRPQKTMTLKKSKYQEPLKNSILYLIVGCLTTKRRECVQGEGGSNYKLMGHLSCLQDFFLTPPPSPEMISV